MRLWRRRADDRRLSGSCKGARGVFKAALRVLQTGRIGGSDVWFGAVGYDCIDCTGISL